MSDESPVEIPKEGLAALRSLVELGAEGIHDFCDAFDATSPVFATLPQRVHLIQEASGRSDDSNTLQEIIRDALLPLHSLRAELEVSAETLYAVIEDGLKIAKAPDWSAENWAAWTQLKPQILRFLELPSVGVELKASELLKARPRWVQSLRLFSDVRPVFDDSVKSINAIIIVNTLCVRYSDNSRARTLYLSLDPEDLDSLREQIDRAQQKNALLEDHYKDSGVAVLKI